MRTKPALKVLPTAMDDPVPSLHDEGWHAARAVAGPPHSIECEVVHHLKQSRGMRFQELSVHRLPDGVCLVGMVHLDEDAADICEVARQVQGVDRVLNRLMSY